MAMASAKTSADGDQVGVPILSCENVCVGFPQYGAAASVALRDVSLTLRAGEVLGLAGESGSGKTLSARAIMRLIPSPGEITKGSIRFGSQDLAELDQESLRKSVAAKSGIMGFTRSPAYEVARDGITVNCVNPGPINTPLLKGLPKTGWSAKGANSQSAASAR